MVFKITDYRVKLCATIVRMFICSSIWFKNVWMCVVCAETSSLILPRCDICFIFQIVHLLVCCVCVIVRQLHFSQALQTINWPLQLMNNLSLYFLLSLLLLFFLFAGTISAQTGIGVCGNWMCLVNSMSRNSKQKPLFANVCHRCVGHRTKGLFKQSH